MGSKCCNFLPSFFSLFLEADEGGKKWPEEPAWGVAPPTSPSSSSLPLQSFSLSLFGQNLQVPHSLTHSLFLSHLPPHRRFYTPQSQMRGRRKEPYTYKEKRDGEFSTDSLRPWFPSFSLSPSSSWLGLFSHHPSSLAASLSLNVSYLWLPPSPPPCSSLETSSSVSLFPFATCSSSLRSLTAIFSPCRVSLFSLASSLASSSCVRLSLLLVALFPISVLGSLSRSLL